MSKKLTLRGDDLAWRTVDEELIAIDVRESTYLTANGSGMLLWSALSEGASKEDLVAKLVAEYEIDAATAAADVEQFLTDLRERGLLDETGAAG
ncbi:MAG: PqqD family protein [Gaiellaceae bacterium]